MDSSVTMDLGDYNQLIRDNINLEQQVEKLLAEKGSLLKDLAEAQTALDAWLEDALKYKQWFYFDTKTQQMKVSRSSEWALHDFMDENQVSAATIDRYLASRTKRRIEADVAEAAAKQEDPNADASS